MSLIEKQFTHDRYVAVYLVGEEFDNYRLDQFLLHFYQNFSRETLKKKILKGEILIEGRNHKLRPSTKVRHRDMVTFLIFNSIVENEYWNGKLLNLELDPSIVFEDQNLLVISKPPFMATHPTGRHLFNCATVYFESKLNLSLHSVHRIDRETSGILLLAKNPRTASQLTIEFEESQVQKAYFFIAKSSQKIDSFEANDRLGARDSGLERVYINHYPENSSEGKTAKTFFKIIHRENGYALGLAFPVSGRQHQIRVHAMAHGFPLVGDKLYLGSYKLFQRFKDNLATTEEFNLMELPRHALHSIALKINYEGTQRTFFAPVAKDLRHYLHDKVSLPWEELEKKIIFSLEEFFIEGRKIQS